MTQDISKALAAVQGGTSPIVASMLHGVSIEEIEAAMPARDTETIAPGYMKPVPLSSLPPRTQVERTRHIRSGQELRAQIRARPLYPTCSETAHTAEVLAGYESISEKTVARRARHDRWPGWHERKVTEQDIERVRQTEGRSPAFLYWVDQDNKEYKSCR